MPEDIKLFYKISRTHSYWGRKPVTDILNSLSDFKKGDMLVDPFCGGGTPTLAALLKGGRVIASDLNPMAVFLTRVICRPIGIPALLSAFTEIKNKVAEKIERRYVFKCPRCGALGHALYFQWEGFGDKEKAVSVKTRCEKCHSVKKSKLNSHQSSLETNAANESPKQWYPIRRIRSIRKSACDFHHQLFTGRNLSSLADLLYEIKQVEPNAVREALLYVFTSILYSCSKMQMYSKKYPKSSLGWMALRFYVPPLRMEKNVWRVFETRFRSFLECKKAINQRLPGIRITNDYINFVKEKNDLLVCEADVFKLPYPIGKETNRVFLDPPYNVDIDYLGFSEFWGCWLGMNFHRNKELIPHKSGVSEYLLIIKRILMLIRQKTSNKIRVTLAFGLKLEGTFKGIETVIQDAGYHLLFEPRQILYTTDRLVKSSKTDTYFELAPGKINGLKNQIKTDLQKEGLIDEAKFYLRAVAHLCRKRRIEGSRKILSETRKYIPIRLLSFFNQLPKKREDLSKYINDIITDPETNRKSYNALVLKLVLLILKTDGYKLHFINQRDFDNTILSAMGLLETTISPLNTCLLDCAFVLDDAVKKLIFCFEDQPTEKLRAIADHIYNTDKIDFSIIAILIVADENKMNQLRNSDYSNDWKRGFFVSLKEIRQKAFDVDEVSALHLCSKPPEDIELSQKRRQSPSETAVYKATVISQTGVGISLQPTHYKLRFSLKALKNIDPGQFIMLNTRALSEKEFATKPLALKSFKTIGSSKRSNFNESPISYLRRPFGIHRAFYPYFEHNYLKKLKLPLSLSNILHTAFPNSFDVLYKVIDNGVGTNELYKIKPEEHIEVLGPLGTGYNPRFVPKDEVDEIHVIGGGVGIAPLVFMVQAFKLFGFNIRAFIGIESNDILYKEKPEDYRVYVDDLYDIGLTEDDIFVSFDREGVTKPDIKHHRIGYISDYYSSELSKLNSSSGKIYGFTCGPEPMWHKVVQIAKQHNVKMHVLLEERMACGIGVCFSCVCQKRDKTNSRVCIDGPIYNAEEIDL